MDKLVVALHLLYDLLMKLKKPTLVILLIVSLFFNLYEADMKPIRTFMSMMESIDKYSVTDKTEEDINDN